MLTDIQGRSTDFVVASDGTVMHGLALIYVLRDVTGIKSFKVVQESRALTRVLLVVDPTFQQQTVPQIVNDFKKRLGSDVLITVDLVDDIPPEASGKYRYVISHA